MAFPQIASTIDDAETVTAATSHTVNLPDNLAAGDLVLLFVRLGVVGSSAITWGTQTWTVLFEDTADASNDRTAVAYRRVTGSEGWSGAGNSLALGCQAASKFVSTAIRITGAADPASLPPEVAIQTPGTTSTSMTFATLAPSGGGGGAKDYLWFVFGGYDGELNSPSTTPPTNFTLISTTSSGTAGAVTTNCWGVSAWRQQNAASQSPGTWSIGTPNSAWSSYTVAVHPVPGVTDYARTVSPLGKGLLVGARTLARQRTATATGVGIVATLRKVDRRRTTAALGTGLLANVRTLARGRIAAPLGRGLLVVVHSVSGALVRTATLLGKGLLSAPRQVTRLRSISLLGRGLLSAPRQVIRPRSTALLGRGLLATSRLLQRGRTASALGKGVLAVAHSVAGLASRSAAPLGRGLLAVVRTLQRVRTASPLGKGLLVVAYLKTSIHRRTTAPLGKGLLVAARRVQNVRRALPLGRGLLQVSRGQPRTVALLGRGTFVSVHKLVRARTAAAIGIGTVTALRRLTRTRQALPTGLGLLVATRLRIVGRSVQPMGSGLLSVVYIIPSKTKASYEFDTLIRPRYSLRAVQTEARFDMTIRTRPRYAFVVRTRRAA